MGSSTASQSTGWPSTISASARGLRAVTNGGCSVAASVVVTGGRTAVVDMCAPIPKRRGLRRFTGTEGRRSPLVTARDG